MNGRWVKSQRAVTFPLQGLDPLRYTVQNGNGSRSSGDVTPQSSVIPEEEAAMDADRGALAVNQEGEVVNASLEFSGNRQQSPAGDKIDSGSTSEHGMSNGVIEEVAGGGCHGDGGDGGGGTGDGGGGVEGATEGGGGETVQEVEQEEDREVSTAKEVGQEVEGGEEGTAEEGGATPSDASSDLRQPKLYNLFATTVSYLYNSCVLHTE